MLPGASVGGVASASGLANVPHVSPPSITVILSSQLGQCQLRSKIAGDTRDRSDGGWKVGTLCLKPYFDEGMCLLLSYHQKWDSTAYRESS